MERAVILLAGEHISQKELPLSITQAYTEKNFVEPRRSPRAPQSLDELEREAIMTTLEATEGNKSETARKLGINRRTLYKKLEKFGVT